MPATEANNNNNLISIKNNKQKLNKHYFDSYNKQQQQQKPDLIDDLKSLKQQNKHYLNKKIPPSSYLNLQKQQQMYQNKFHSGGSDLSSNISSNNLTCSDLDTSNMSQDFIKLQRKKLIKCILREDLDLLKALINKQDLLKIRDKHKNTLLHIACGFGRLKSIQFLLSVCQALLYEVDDKGHNAIDVAIKHGQTDVLKWLISSNIISDFDNICTNGHRSILHLAAKHGENEILRLICNEIHKRQLSLDIQDAAGNTAAHLAAKYNHLDCLQTLVEYNCDITLCNKYGHTPCFIAEFNANTECVHYLMIVETCINLSIKVVKLSRKLRETKANNDILKAQMDEAIAINNDFINQRENTLHISLDLMQKQINDIENKIFNEIERLNNENIQLKQQIDQLSKSNVGQINKKQVKLDDNNNNNEKVMDIMVNNLNIAKTELLNTRNNCNKILIMDNKKMENVRLKFNQIKNYIEMNETNNSSNLNADDFEDENKEEYLEVLRKMYQEATHKLMIFRNMIKERQRGGSTSSSQCTPTISVQLNSNRNMSDLNDDTSIEPSLLMGQNMPNIRRHHAKLVNADGGVNGKQFMMMMMNGYRYDEDNENQLIENVIRENEEHESGTEDAAANSSENNTIIENYNLNNKNFNEMENVDANNENENFYQYSDEQENEFGELMQQQHQQQQPMQEHHNYVNDGEEAALNSDFNEADFDIICGNINVSEHLNCNCTYDEQNGIMNQNNTENDGGRVLHHDLRLKLNNSDENDLSGSNNSNYNSQFQRNGFNEAIIENNSY